MNNKKLICTLGLCLLPTLSQAAIINFDFTGRLIVTDASGFIIMNNDSTVTDIAASLTYNTETGLGGNSADNNLRNIVIV